MYPIEKTVNAVSTTAPMDARSGALTLVAGLLLSACGGDGAKQAFDTPLVVARRSRPR